MKVSKAQFMEVKMRQQEALLKRKNAIIKSLKKEKDALEEMVEEYQVENAILKENLENVISDLSALACLPVELDDALILNVMRVNRRPFYNSEWKVVFLNDSGYICETKVTRHDDETVIGILKDIIKINSYRMINSICLKNKIPFN